MQSHNLRFMLCFAQSSVILQYSKHSYAKGNLSPEPQLILSIAILTSFGREHTDVCACASLCIPIIATQLTYHEH